MSSNAGKATYEGAIYESNNGTVLNLLVRTGSKSPGFAGFDPWRPGLIMRVKAQPSGGAANEELIDLTAKLFAISPKMVEIISGKRSTQKKILLVGVTLQAVKDRLEVLLK